MLLAVFIMTVILYSLNLVRMVGIMLPFKMLAKISLYLISLLEILSYIALIIIYSMSISDLQKVDQVLLAYARDNQCSDSVL